MSDPLIGARLGNYQIESSLGRGGMARVYRALDVTLRRMVALKVIEPDLRDLSNYSAQFEREAQAIAALEHPNIVHVYYFGEADGLYYLVMKYIEGVELRDLMDLYFADRQSLPTVDLLRIFEAVGSALDYAHNLGVIHRDVKPSNIIIDRNGQPYLTDFGLALNVSQGAIGEVFGTPHYIAPEQARSSANAVPQSDLYSLGVILYELFTGVVPFDDPVPTAIALQHIMKEPTPPHVINPNLAPSMEMVIMKALAKSADERYQTGEALNSALKQALRGMTGAASEGQPVVERVSTILAQEKAAPDEIAAFSGSTPGFADSEIFTKPPPPISPPSLRDIVSPLAERLTASLRQVVSRRKQVDEDAIIKDLPPDTEVDMGLEEGKPTPDKVLEQRVEAPEGMLWRGISWRFENWGNLTEEERNETLEEFLETPVGVVLHERFQLQSASEPAQQIVYQAEPVVSTLEAEWIDPGDLYSELQKVVNKKYSDYEGKPGRKPERVQRIQAAIRGRENEDVYLDDFAAYFPGADARQKRKRAATAISILNADLKEVGSDFELVGEPCTRYRVRKRSSK